MDTESSSEDEKVVIYPIQSHKTMLDYYNSLLPEMIPKIPLSTLICGARNSGKTTALINLVVRYYSRIYKQRYIYLFSPSVYLDPQYKLLDCNKFEEFDESLVQKLMDDLKKSIKEYGKDRTPRCLIMLDDIISDPNTHNSHSLISSLYIKGRHYNCDVILLSQSLTMVSTSIRKNSLSIILFNSNEAEKEVILKEFGSRAVKKQMYNMMDYVFNERYNSLYIDLTAHKEERFIKNFNEYLNYKNF